MTGAAGAVLGKPRFDAFGGALPGNDVTKIGFTSHRAADETGLIDMGGRFYDPLPNVN